MMSSYEGHVANATEALLRTFWFPFIPHTIIHFANMALDRCPCDRLIVYKIPLAFLQIVGLKTD